jgi:hypothetical protein
VDDFLRTLEAEALVMLHCVLPDRAALAVNALLWGWWSHRVLHPDSALDEQTVRQAYEVLVALPSEGHPFHKKEQNGA